MHLSFYTALLFTVLKTVNSNPVKKNNKKLITVTTVSPVKINTNNNSTIITYIIYRKKKIIDLYRISGP